MWLVSVAPVFLLISVFPIIFLFAPISLSSFHIYQSRAPRERGGWDGRQRGSGRESRRSPAPPLPRRRPRSCAVVHPMPPGFTCRNNLRMAAPGRKRGRGRVVDGRAVWLEGLRRVRSPGGAAGRHQARGLANLAVGEGCVAAGGRRTVPSRARPRVAARRDTATAGLSCLGGYRRNLPRGWSLSISAVGVVTSAAELRGRSAVTAGVCRGPLGWSPLGTAARVLVGRTPMQGCLVRRPGPC